MLLEVSQEGVHSRTAFMTVAREAALPNRAKNDEHDTTQRVYSPAAIAIARTMLGIARSDELPIPTSQPHEVVAAEAVEVINKIVARADVKIKERFRARFDQVLGIR